MQPLFPYLIQVQLQQRMLLMVEQDISFGVHVLMVVQDLQLLVSAYGQRTELSVPKLIIKILTLDGIMDRIVTLVKVL